jgi:ATP-binding cassette subfamily B protein
MGEFKLKEAFIADRRTPFRWIASHSLRQWWLWILAIIGAIGNAALASVTPIMIGRAFSELTSTSIDLNQIGNYALIVGLSQVLRSILQFSRTAGFEILAQRTEKSIRNELYGSLLEKSMTFHSLQPIGDTMARASNDVREVNLLFSPGINLVLGSLIFLVMPLFIVPSYHPSLIITPIIFSILYFLALWQYMRELNPVTEKVRQAFGVMNSRLSETLDGIETVKGATQEKNEVSLFKKNIKTFRDFSVRQGDIEARYLPLLLFSLSMAAGLFHSLVLYRQGVLTLGEVVGYFGVLGMLEFPTFTSLWAYSRISLGIAGAKRILELINKKNDLDQNLEGKVKPLSGGIKFDSVTFAYNDTDPTLTDISFEVKPGQTVAIVGQTGTGKTTLTKLINRTYDANKGTVEVDGLNVKDWQLASLRRGISVIEQDIFLFSSSISDNIAFGKPDATEEEIINAAKLAQAHDFILDLPDKYQTVIGERGATLSGGQRQRIALARAFLVEPKILILDDSTSAIDSATEDKIQRAIYTAAYGRTTILITHRLSQIRWADLIIVLKQGKIAALGTHEELMASSRDYQRIFSET